MRKDLPANEGDAGNCSFIPRVGKSPRRRAWQPTPIFLPRSLAGYTPRGRKESDTTESTARTAIVQKRPFMDPDSPPKLAWATEGL